MIQGRRACIIGVEICSLRKTGSPCRRRGPGAGDGRADRAGGEYSAAVLPSPASSGRRIAFDDGKITEATCDIPLYEKAFGT